MRLVLSENTGVHDELGAFSLAVNPFDIGDQAEKLYQALTMPKGERRALRAQGLTFLGRSFIFRYSSQPKTRAESLRNTTTTTRLPAPRLAIRSATLRGRLGMVRCLRWSTLIDPD